MAQLKALKQFHDECLQLAKFIVFDKKANRDRSLVCLYGTLIEKLKAEGMLAYEDAEQVKFTEDKLRTLVAAEKKNG